jgi:hypothetical protein
MRRFETLKNELQYTKSTLEKANLRKASVAGIQEVNASVNNTGDATVMPSSTHRPSLIGPLSRILPDRLVPQTDDERNERKHYKNASKLKVAFSEFYLMLALLQKFQLLNFSGFRKILKKHDKLFQTTRGEEWR